MSSSAATRRSWWSLCCSWSWSSSLPTTEYRFLAASWPSAMTRRLWSGGSAWACTSAICSWASWSWPRGIMRPSWLFGCRGCGPTPTTSTLTPLVDPCWRCSRCFRWRAGWRYVAFCLCLQFLLWTLKLKIKKR